MMLKEKSMNLGPSKPEAMPTSPDLTIICPSRGRPEALAQLSSAFVGLCERQTRLIFVVDDDDPLKSRYFAKNPFNTSILVAPPTIRGMNGAMNWAFRHLERSGELGFAIGFMGDDHRPRTPGWDDKYLRALELMGQGFVYGNDLLQGENLPTQVAFTTDIARALGYMCPDEFQHLNIDVVWKDWGQAIGRLVYLDDVIVEHLHPLAGKARMDKNYRAVNNILVVRHDVEAYNLYKSNGRFAEDVGKLKMLLENNWWEPWS